MSINPLVRRKWLSQCDLKGHSPKTKTSPMHNKITVDTKTIAAVVLSRSTRCRILGSRFIIVWKPAVYLNQLMQNLKNALATKACHYRGS